MSSCPRGTNNTEDFTGISMDIFRAISSDAKGWVQGEDYIFVCLPDKTTDEGIDYTLSPEGLCDAFIAATTITEDRTSKGIVWAYPYLGSHLSVVIKSSDSQNNGWNWTLPFTWQLWMALGLSIPTLGAILVLCEFFTYRKSPKWGEMGKEWLSGIYLFTVLFITGNPPEIMSIATRLVMMSSIFLALIINASYTANLASYLTLKGNSEINSIYDLTGRALSAPDLYVDDLQSRYGLYPVPVVLRSEKDIISQIDLVSQGKLAAFIVDKEIAEKVVSSYPECGVKLLPGAYNEFNYGLAFDPRKEAELADDFTLSILRLTENGDVYSIIDEYTLDESECLNPDNLASDLSKISFAQVYGLWVIVGATVVLGIVYILLSRKLKTKRMIWEDEHAQSDVTMTRQKSDVLS